MLNNFNKTVLMISIIILIILLAIIGLVMFYSEKNSIFPPVVSECPDYWNVTKENNQTMCENILKINPKSVSQTDSCNKVNPINFKGPDDEDTLCNKYKWSKNCNVLWDGVTNNNKSCVI